MCYISNLKHFYFGEKKKKKQSYSLFCTNKKRVQGARKTSNYWNAVAEVIPIEEFEQKKNIVNVKKEFGINYLNNLLCDCANKWSNSDNGWHLLSSDLGMFVILLSLHIDNSSIIVDAHIYFVFAFSLLFFFCLFCIY